MKNHSKKCWNCGSTDLTPDGRGVRCRNCNATWNPVPKTGQYPMKIAYDPALGQSGSPYGAPEYNK